MQHLLRACWLLAAALLFAVAGPGSDGGGGGDSGVWILPRSAPISQLPLSGMPAQQGARDWRSLTTPKEALVLQLPGEMASAVAALRDVASGAVLPVHTVGGRVVLPLRTLQAMLSAGASGQSLGVIVDGQGRGFLLVVRRTAADTLRVEVH
jgi:hypothetical protein